MASNSGIVFSNNNLLDAVTSYMPDVGALPEVHRGVQISPHVREEIYERNLQILQRSCPDLYAQMPDVLSNYGRMKYFYEHLRGEQTARIQAIEGCQLLTKI